MGGMGGVGGGSEPVVHDVIVVDTHRVHGPNPTMGNAGNDRYRQLWSLDDYGASS